MTTPTTADAALPRAPLSDGQRVFAIFAASSGNLVEWYDFYVYAFTAIYFAPAFFPADDPTIQLLNSAAVFAIGFLMRPIGGWVFGRIADRYGRRRSMIISVLMMCMGSLVIACLPTYATIGALAPLLLLLARMAQGLSVGGEYGTSATYMSEVAKAGRRGFFGSFQYVTLIGGQLLASLVILILALVLSTEEMRAWGWRIPFFIGAATAVIALFLRRTLEETLTDQARKREEAGSLLALLRRHPRAFITVLGFTAGGSLIFYTFTTYMQKYLINTAHMETRSANIVMTSALFVYMCLQPPFGALSDRIGRRNSMLLFGGLATVVTVPLLTALGSVSNPWTAFVLIMIALAVISLYTSISGLVKAELFPAEVRALGVGFAYALANAVFGGSAEYVALLFKSVGAEAWFFWYVSIMCAIAFVVAVVMRDSRKGGYLQGEHVD
ncbi:MFS family transporter [Chelatococcus reniformis]|uniref:Alpha-ketoglutarate permease n=1 Tax=Chelatococcus reniformis TaxID=1494448 RepID=A0A916UAA1_9HYPH|nr:MFS family transporter [Chelatococcus reniformis]GGC63770.1 MFS transporter [Chelatococcus reniformis]